MSLLTIRTAIGPLPLLPPKTEEEEEREKAEIKEEKKEIKAATTPSTPSTAAKKSTNSTLLLPDGTYATQSAAATVKPDSKAASNEKKSNTNSALRTLLIDGDYFLSSSLANAITKLLLRYSAVVGLGSTYSNEEIAKGLQLLVSILRLGSSPNAPKPIDLDSYQRLMLCIRVLLEPKVGNNSLRQSMVLLIGM